MALVTLSTSAMMAQTGSGAVEREVRKPSKAWEFGIGGTLVNWNRISLTGFQHQQNGDYHYDLRVDHLMGGGNSINGFISTYKPI